MSTLRQDVKGEKNRRTENGERKEGRGFQGEKCRGEEGRINDPKKGR